MLLHFSSRIMFLNRSTMSDIQSTIIKFLVQLASNFDLRFFAHVLAKHLVVLGLINSFLPPNCNSSRISSGVIVNELLPMKKPCSGISEVRISIAIFTYKSSTDFNE